MSTCSNLQAIDWSDISFTSPPGSYKLMNLDSDDCQLLAKTYQAMYPNRHIEAFTVAEVCRKYSSVTLSGEKIGSRLECHSLRSARLMASWANQEGKVDPSDLALSSFL